MICSTRDSTGDTSLPWLELVTSLSIRGSLYFLTTDQRRFCPGRLYVGNVLCYIDMVRVKNSLDCWVLIDHNNHWATELPANTIITNWIYTDDKVVCQKHGWSYLQIGSKFSQEVFTNLPQNVIKKIIGHCLQAFVFIRQLHWNQLTKQFVKMLHPDIQEINTNEHSLQP